MFRDSVTRACGLVLAYAVCAAAAPRPANSQEIPGPGPDPGPALAAAAEMRRRFDPSARPVYDSWLALRYRGRPSIEVKGRTPGGGEVRDIAIVDLDSGTPTVFVYFPNASRRSAGEAILPMSEISVRADVHLRNLLPGEDLALAGIQRYRASGEESIYYEVRYAPATAAIPFFDPPVGLLLDASTGALFRFVEDPGWRSVMDPGGARLSTRAAQRIAAVSLRSRGAATAVGAEASAAVRVLGADLFYVRPNGWLGADVGDEAAALHLAWVVGFSVAGAAPPGPHTLAIDAETGRFLGGERAPTR